MKTQLITTRKATVRDADAIAAIVNLHAQTGVMLPRPISRIYENIRDYVVVEVGGEIVGCGAVHVMWADLAEIRAVAIRSEDKGRGYGRALVEALVDEAIGLDVDRVFVLTYQVDFFGRMGFNRIDKSELPHKIWSECVNCIHFPNCDEVAMIRYLKNASNSGQL